MQASAHIEAIAAIVSVEEIVVWGRNPEKALALANHESRRLSLPVRAGSAKEAAACDIVNTVTSASSPVLFNDWIRPGAHVNLVGSHTPDAREADGSLMAHKVYVDWMPSALSEAGDVLQAIAEGHLTPDDLVELGQVLYGDQIVPRDATAVTVYKSVGFGAQDLYAAQHVYQRATELGVGIDADWPFE